MSDHQAPDRSWRVVFALGGALFALGVIGFNRYAAWHGLPYTLQDKIYLTLQLILINSGGVETPIPLELELARFGTPFLTAFSAIKAFWNLFSQQIRVARLRSIGGHIVICGLIRKGTLLASHFARHGDRVVVIEKNEENIWLESCRGENIPVLVGNAADPGLLKRAGAARARAVAPGPKFQNPLWAVKFPAPTAVNL